MGMGKNHDSRDSHPVHESLPVRTRSTVRSGGETSERLTVWCSHGEVSRSLHDCVLCVDCVGVRHQGDGIEVVCRQPASSDAPDPRGRRPTAASRLPLSAIMTSDVVCVTPDLELSTLVALLVDRGISGAPVVDDAGRPIGIVSKSDLVRARLDDPWIDDAGDERGLEPGFHLEPTDSRRVSDVMMPIAFTLPEAATVSQAAAIMAYERIHRVPVVTTDGSVVGIVCALDIVAWLAAHDGYAVHPNERDRRTS